MWAVLVILQPITDGDLVFGRFIQLAYSLVYFLALKALLNKRILSTKIVQLLIFWSIYISVVNLIHSFNSPLSYLETMKDTLWWPSVFVIFYDALSRTEISNCILYIRKYFLAYFILVLSLLIYLIIFFSGNTDISSGVVNQNEINSVYWLLLILPFCFYLKPFYKYSLFFIGFVMIIISSKRSPLVAFGFILMFSLYRDYFTMNVKSILIVPLSFVIILFTLNSISDNISINSSERLMTTDIKSEPRAIFIAESVEILSTKGPLNLTFGSGHRSTAIDRGREMSKTTHNDFFETLYCYGVVGLIFYLYLITYLIKRLKFLRKDDEIYHDAHVSALIILFVISNLSHLNMYPTYFAFLVIVWAITESKISTYK